MEDILTDSIPPPPPKRGWGLKRKVCYFMTFMSVFLLPVAHACIQSSDLRDRAANSLLFWSSYDFSVDAATQFLGPLAAFELVSTRGGAYAAAADGSDATAAAFDVTPTASYTIDPPDMSGLDTNEDDSTNNSSLLAADSPPQTNTSFSLVERSTVVSDKDKLVFSLFQEGDGSGSDPDGIPTRFLVMQDGHRGRAVKAVADTLEWRQENDIDHLLRKPQPKFDLCKQVFPHYFVGRDKDDHVVFLQRPAYINLELGYRNKLTKEELLMHYVYVNEYLWQVLEGDKPLGTMTSILDLSGLDFSVLKKTDLIGFCKKFVQTMDSHYPQRAHKTLILNVPKWFNVMYKMMTPLLRASTKSKIEVFGRGKKQDEAIIRVLGDDVAKQLPPRFWSKRKQKGHHHHNKENKENNKENNTDEANTADIKGHHHGHHHHHHHEKDNWVPPETDLEKDLRQFTLERLKEAGVEMQPVI